MLSGEGVAAIVSVAETEISAVEVAMISVGRGVSVARLGGAVGSVVSVGTASDVGEAGTPSSASTGVNCHASKERQTMAPNDNFLHELSFTVGILSLITSFELASHGFIMVSD